MKTDQQKNSRALSESDVYWGAELRPSESGNKLLCSFSARIENGTIEAQNVYIRLYNSNGKEFEMVYYPVPRLSTKISGVPASYAFDNELIEIPPEEVASATAQYNNETRGI